MQTKKFIVLAVLFLLPISVYMFFASGKDNFVNLATLTTNVGEMEAFQSVSGDSVRLKDRITVLMFFGSDLEAKKANAFNLAHKIYKKNYQFKEFQFVSVIAPGQEATAIQLKKDLAKIEDPKNWHFVTGSQTATERLFKSLKSDLLLDQNGASDYVFIIDKELKLRGRDDDEDVGLLYGFNAANYAEINNKMSDDIKIVLAEYRLALKKYKADRKDAFRDKIKDSK
ncbi:MAG: hypothetical protein AAF466_03690 [Bacteroidota bacterium]